MPELLYTIQVRVYDKGDDYKLIGENTGAFISREVFEFPDKITPFKTPEIEKELSRLLTIKKEK